MRRTPRSTLNDPQQIIVDLKRQLSESNAERDHLRSERDEALERETATTEVLQIINSSPGDLAPVFDAMLEKAMRLCEADCGHLYTYDGDRFHPITVRGEPRFVEWWRQSGPILPLRNSPGPLGRVARGERIVSVDDFREDAAYRTGPTFRAMVDASNTRSGVTVALRNDIALLGAITIYRQEVRPFADKQISLLENFAAQAVIAMENARLITETREALEQQTATAEVLQVINSSPGDLAPVFDAMIERAVRLCGASHGMLRTFDGRSFHLAAVHDDPRLQQLGPGEALETLPTGDLLGRIVNDGEQLVHIADIRETDTYREDPAIRDRLERGGIRTWLAVALHKDGTLLGVITVYRREVRPFSEKEIALLQNFAAQAVIAMENARLITETREALEQQTATAEVLQVINSSPGDLTPVFDAMLDKAMRLCGAVHGSLTAYDGEHFRCVASHNQPEALFELLSKPRRAAPNSPQERLLQGERIVHIADMAEVWASPDDPVAHAAAQIGFTRTVLFVPLRKDNVLLGYITAARREVQPFTDKQIALLQNFAAQAVIAMENARLITETREALEQQTATAEVLGVINSSPGDLAPVFDAILEKAMHLCEAAFGELRTYDGGRFRTAAIRGVPATFAEHRRLNTSPAGRGSLGARVLEGERVIHVLDLKDDEAYRAGDANRRSLVDLGGARTVLVASLHKDDTALGFITLYRQEVRPYSDKQIALLQNFAAQAVIAMENARLLGELRQRTDEVAELNRGLEARVAEQVDELGRVGRLKRFLAPQLAELIVSQGDEKILESHRREIVVVFCDLRGYTAFTETAEPEEVLDFLREYHGALGPLVSQFEGTLDQFSGDGIMVFFNDPVPCPDPAERAVKMAVAMRSAASTLISRWRERGRDLGFGAGIAQGYATLGQIGFSERSGYTAIGTVCNVAARLCAEAKDGQILLGQRVNVELNGSVATEQLGPLVLKGLTQPVVAYNVPLGAIQPALRIIEGGNPETV